MIEIHGREGIDMEAEVGQVYNVMGMKVRFIEGSCPEGCLFAGDDERCLFAPSCDYGVYEVYVEVPDEEA